FRIPLLVDRNIPIVLLQASGFAHVRLCPRDDEFTPVLADHVGVFDAETRFRQDLDPLGVDWLATDFTRSALLGHAISFPGIGAAFRNTARVLQVHYQPTPGSMSSVLHHSITESSWRLFQPCQGSRTG